MLDIHEYLLQESEFISWLNREKNELKEIHEINKNNPDKWAKVRWRKKLVGTSMCLKNILYTIVYGLMENVFIETIKVVCWSYEFIIFKKN